MNLPVPRIGSTTEWSSQILSFLFALHFLFGSILVANNLELHLFYYFPRRIQISILDPRIDVIVWILSIASMSILGIHLCKDKRRIAIQTGAASCAIILILSSLLYPNKTVVYLLFLVGAADFLFIALNSRLALGQTTGTFISRVLVYLLAFFLTVEVSSGIHYIIRPFDRTTQIGRMDADIELQFSYASYGLLPWIYASFLFSWVWVPFVHRLLIRTRIFQSSFSNLYSQRTFVRSHSHKLSVLLDYRIYLALAFAAFIGYYPYFQNPPWLVGTDAYWRYYNPLLRMNERGIAGGFAQALEERHPLPLALLYAAQLMFHTTPFEVVRLAPLLIVTVLALCTSWFLVNRGGTGLALTVFTFSILSVTTTVGMHSSILANWMAFVVWMFFFVYVAMRGDGRLRALDAIALLAMSTLILLIHPWTWGVFATSVVVFVIINLLHERRQGLSVGITLILIIFVDVLLAFVSLTVLEGSEGWRIAETLQYYDWAARQAGSLLIFCDALTRLTEVWTPFFSPLYMVTSILGVFYLQAANMTSWRRRLILAWICTSAVGSILVAPVGWNPAQPKESESQLWRLLFLTPFQLTAPFGAWLVTDILRRPRRVNEDSSNLEGMHDFRRTVMLAVVFTAGLVLALMPIQGRPILMLAAFPVAVGLVFTKAEKRSMELLGDMMLACFILVAFNCATRSLAQLLIDPHNYMP